MPRYFAQLYQFNNISNIVRCLYEKPPYDNRKCGCIPLLNDGSNFCVLATRYVDFTDIHKYATRLNHELLPRIGAATADAVQVFKPAGSMAADTGKYSCCIGCATVQTQPPATLAPVVRCLSESECVRERVASALQPLPT